MNNQENNQKGLVKIYYRAMDIINNDNIPEGPRIHPVLKDWNDNYYELGIKIKARKINVLKGKLNEISKTSQYVFKENPEADEIIEVDKEKFLEAIEEFITKCKNTEYRLFNFSRNCIGFKDYVLKKSRIKA